MNVINLMRKINIENNWISFEICSAAAAVAPSTYIHGKKSEMKTIDKVIAIAFIFGYPIQHSRATVTVSYVCVSLFKILRQQHPHSFWWYNFRRRSRPCNLFFEAFFEEQQLNVLTISLVMYRFYRILCLWESATRGVLRSVC